MLRGLPRLQSNVVFLLGVGGCDLSCFKLIYLRRRSHQPTVLHYHMVRCCAGFPDYSPIGFLRGGGGGWGWAVTLLKTHLKDEYSHEHTIHNAERPGPFYRYAN